MQVQSQLISGMMKRHEGEPHLVQHFLKVYAFAKTIGELEGLDEKTQYTLELAAIVHDVGILVSFAKYGECTHRQQKLEGPPVARELLGALDVPGDVTERVCHLVGRHHTWDNVEGQDYQILLEADFLVNAHEKSFPIEKLIRPFQRMFRTDTGKVFFYRMFDPERLGSGAKPSESI